MTDPHIIKVMESMGWTDGSLLPIANDENRKIMTLITELSQSKITKTSEIESEGARLENVQEHIKSHEGEFDHNMKLLHAHESHMRTEHHFFKVSELEFSRLKQQKKQLEKSMTDLEGYEENLQSDIKKKNASMKKLSEKIEWSKEILQEWRQIMSRGEAANDMIEKYCKLDNNKAETLESRRRRLQMAIIKQKSILINTIQEHKSMTSVLEKTRLLYQQAHVERKDLVNTWKEAVHQMNHRTKDIQHAENELRIERDRTQKKTMKLENSERKFNNQIQDNREVEMIMNILNVESSQVRTRLEELLNKISLTHNEYTLQRKMVHTTAQRLTLQQNQNRQKSNEENEKKKQIEVGNTEYQNLLTKYENFKNNNFNAQERLKQVDEIIDGEERSVKLLDAETTRLGAALFRAQQQLIKLQEEDKILNVEIEATDCGILKLKIEIKRLKKHRSREEETLYNIKYAVQKLDARIAYMRGATAADENSLRLMEKLLRLETKQKERKKKLATLQEQVGKVEENLKKIKAAYQIDGEEYTRLLSELKVSRRTLETCEKQLRLSITDSQETLVEESLMKMRIYQLDKQLAKQNDKFYTLEKHKMDLEAAINERLLDINAQKDVLLMKRKCLTEERTQLRADIAERTIKIEQMKKRFENANDLLGKNDDGTEITATQIKIRTAQEKYILLKEGNELNAQVLKAEEDIKAMENTLRLMNYSNDHYKKSFNNMDNGSSEMKRLIDLENEYCKALNDFKSLRHNLAEKSATIDYMAADKLDKMYEEMEKIKLDKCDLLYKLEKELGDQSTKIQRAERELKLAFRSVRSKMLNDDIVKSFEKDMNLRELEERNNSALQQLADIVDNNPFMNETVLKYFCQHGLKMPESKRMKSQTSCRSDQSPDDFSMRVNAISKKLMSSSSSSVSSKSSGKSQAQSVVSKVAPAVSVVTIDFPIPDRASESSRSSGPRMSNNLGKK